MSAVFTLDTHIDIRWPNPPDPRLEGPMRVDFPKMERGGLRGAVFVAYVPQGRRDAAGHAEAAARAEAMLRHIRGRADGVARRFCATAAELEEAVAAGWFGEVAPHCLDRIGDVVAAARGTTGIIRSAAEPTISGLPGQHGSLSAAEQFVPLLLATPS